MCCRELLERIVLHIRYSLDKVVFGALFVLAYAFSLRLPSEALPAVLECGDRKVDAQAVLKFEGAEAVLRAVEKKVLVHHVPTDVPGPCFTRSVDLLWAWWCLVSWCYCGSSPQGSSGSTGRIVCVPVAGEYRTQDFLWEHTEDLRASGILALVVCSRVSAFVALLEGLLSRTYWNQAIGGRPHS